MLTQRVIYDSVHAIKSISIRKSLFDSLETSTKVHGGQVRRVNL